MKRRFSFTTPSSLHLYKIFILLTVALTSVHSDSLENFLSSSSEPINIQNIQNEQPKGEFYIIEGDHKANLMLKDMKKSVRKAEKNISKNLKKFMPFDDLDIKTRIRHDKIESNFIYPLYDD